MPTAKPGPTIDRIFLHTLKFLLLLAACLTILLPTHAAQSQSAPPAPFIYYYSRAAQAFIIERADGTESRILASYAAPIFSETYGAIQQVIGPGWSPSGQWLAWHTSDPWNHRYIGRQAYVVPRTGGEPQLLLNDAMPIDALKWSPTADQLLIWRRAVEPIENTSSFRDAGRDEITVYDMTTQQIVWRRTAPELNAAYDDLTQFVDAAWTPDGNSVALVFFRQEAPDAPLEGVLQLVSAAPTVERAIWLPPPENDCYGRAATLSPFWSPDGKTLYTTPDGADLVIEDFAAGTQVAIPAPEDPVYYVDWNPHNSDYALIYTLRASGGCWGNFKLWLLSVPEQTLTQLPDDSVEQVSKQVQRPYTRFAPYYAASTWSPTGDYAAFASEAGPFLYLFDLQNRALTALIAYTGYVPGESLRWTADGAQLLYIYRPPDALPEIHSYDPLTDTARVVASADCTMLSQPHDAHLFCSPVAQFGIAYHIDLASGALTEIPFMDTEIESELWLHAYFALWNSDSEWFFWTAHLDVGGGGGPWRLTIANPDFSGYRELGYCYLDEPSCFGWLPEE